MKKILATFMALLMIAGLMTGLAVTSSADEEQELEYVEEVYSFDALANPGDWGEGKNPIANGLWRFDYWDFADNKFKPMTAWEGSDGGAAGQNTYFEPIPDLVLEQDASPYFYCRHRANGTQMHPGSQADAVRTFIVPASGKIIYDFEIQALAEGNIAGSSETAGDAISVYLNDTLIWPAASYVDGETVTEADVAAGFVLLYYDSPLSVSISNLDVEAGDEIHLRVGANGNKGGKATQVDLNTVTYVTCELPIGDPKGVAPANLTSSDVGTTTATISWEAARNAKGYNVYVNDEKVNEEEITELTYKLEGLAPGAISRVTVTTVTEIGESDPSEVLSIRTQKEDTDASSDEPTVTDSGSNNNSGSNSTNTTSNENTGWIIGIVAGVIVLLAALIIVFVVMSKKKKSDNK